MFYVVAVISESASSVVMVNNAVIDVTPDGGHQWYQYVNAAGDWTIARHPVSDGIGLRVSPGPDKTLPKESYATYVLVVAQHKWQRTGQSGG
jgi:hypothetical protein